MRMFEELSMNAWPALQTILYDGWVLRFAEGFTRRANSVNPIYPSTEPIKKKIEACERIYSAKGQKTVFKLMPFTLPQNMDGLLEARGYAKANLTALMTLDLGIVGKTPASNVIIYNKLDDCWLEEACRMNGIDAADRTIMGKMLQNLLPKCLFVSLKEDDKTVACGMTVLENGYMGLFDIVVERDLRGRGFGKQLMKELLRLGKSEGASTAYLQVMLDNLPAVRLYEGLGFRKAYEYWYREADCNTISVSNSSPR